MRAIMILIVAFTFFHCNSDQAKTNQKKKETIARVLFFIINIRGAVGIPEKCYGEAPAGWETNLKSIDIYFNGSFFFNTTINTSNILWNFSCMPPKYSISINENSKLKSITVYMKLDETTKKYEYTGVRLGFKDNIFKDYQMNFNGDLDTFTDFTVGEYRFVAVR
jgi:hypothetical protein